MDDLALVFYDYQEFEALTALALGAVPSRSSDDTQLQVRNPSLTYQADDVTVAVSGPNANQLWLSVDGEAFYSQINIGLIAPSGGSQPFWLRRVTPSTASGTGTANLTATPAAWTDPVDVSASANVGLDTDTSLTDDDDALSISDRLPIIFDA